MSDVPVKGTYAENFGEGYQDHLIAVLARTPAAVIRYRSAFDHTYFATDVQRVLAKALLTHVDKYQTTPTKTLLVEEAKLHAGKELAGKIEKHVNALYADDVSDAKATLDKAVDFGRLQAMCNAVLAGAEQLDKGDRSGVMTLVQNAMHVGEDILDMGINYTAADRVNIYNEVASADDYVPTGISHLDRLMGGGGLRGGLYCVLAPPGRGKTTVLINIGFGPLLMPEEYVVCHATHEISAKRVLMRYDARLAGKYYPLRKSDPDKYAQVMNERAKQYIKGKLFIKGWPTRTCGVSNIRSWLSMLGGYNIRPDVIIVDYADIMKPERRLGEMRHEQAGIYEDLRGLAGEYNATGWTASQTSKGALEKETPDLGDFAETFEKAAVIDGGFALCQSSDESIENRCRLFGMKLRDEQDRSTVECKINRTLCHIRSTGLFDQALMRIQTPDDDPEDEDFKVQATPVSKPKEKGGWQKKSGGSATSKKAVFKKTIIKDMIVSAAVEKVTKVAVKKPEPVPDAKVAVKKG